MPLQPQEPRPSLPRMHLRQKEKKLVQLELQTSVQLARLMHVMATLKRRNGRLDMERTLRKYALIFSAVSLISVMSLEQIFTHSHASDFPKRKGFMDFSAQEFVNNFRFGQHHFHHIMQVMDLTSADGRLMWIHFGKPGHKQWVRADWALMVLTKRLAVAGNLETVCRLLGGSRTLVSSTFNMMVDLVFRREDLVGLSRLELILTHQTCFLNLMKMDLSY